MSVGRAGHAMGIHEARHRAQVACSTRGREALSSRSHRQDRVQDR